MDPNTNLRRQIELADSLLDETHDVDPDDAIELAELVLALDNWIRSGAALPAAWPE